MALWDSADLLARFLRKSGVPSVRSFPEDADIYAWLTEANVELHHQIAQHAPWSQYGALVKLVTSDGGETYTFPTGVWPIGSIELYSTAVRGSILVPGTFWDPNAAYTFEGDKIRIPLGKSRTFDDGPYARYMESAGEISATTEPTIKPPTVRQILVELAVSKWAERGGMKDPAPFLLAAQRLWTGDGVTHFGVLGMLKSQNAFQGMEAFSQESDGVLGSVNTGAGYPAL